MLFHHGNINGLLEISKQKQRRKLIGAGKWVLINRNGMVFFFRVERINEVIVAWRNQMLKPIKGLFYSQLFISVCQV